MSPIEQFVAAFREALERDSLVKLTLGRPAADAGDVRRAVLRRVQLRAGPRVQRVIQHARRDDTANLDDAEAVSWVAANAGTGFLTAYLATTARDLQLVAEPGKPARLNRHKPTSNQILDTAHDRVRGRLLDPLAAPWLATLGITDPRGQVRERMGDKFRQVARYIELLDDLVDDLGWRRGRRVTAVDMGSGRGTLTFAAWHLLRVLRGLDASVTGIEERTELVALCEGAAREHGCEGLSFREGRIGPLGPGGADIVIALHACNTATDDAIRSGIDAGADLILAAPCCHRELRPQLDGWGGHGLLAPILRHGLMRERFSEWLTDGLRALHLELAGYDTKVIEFVGGEHTPKNLLLAAVKRQRPATPGLKEKIEAIKAQFGVATQALDPGVA